MGEERCTVWLLAPSPPTQTRIDSYFTRINEIIKKGKVPARIKFMLQDVQELRGNKWVPRVRQEQSLKTIDQVSSIHQSMST